jgi:hypothetical protein
MQNAQFQLLQKAIRIVIATIHIVIQRDNMMIELSDETGASLTSSSGWYLFI